MTDASDSRGDAGRMCDECCRHGFTVRQAAQQNQETKLEPVPPLQHTHMREPPRDMTRITHIQELLQRTTPSGPEVPLTFCTPQHVCSKNTGIWFQ